MSSRSFSIPAAEGTTSVAVAVPAVRNEAPHLHLLDCTSDDAAGAVSVSRGASEHEVIATTNSPGASATLRDVTGLSEDDQVVVELLGGPSIVRTLTGVDDETGVVTFTAAGAAIPAGSRVFRMSALTTLPVGDANKQYESAGDHSPLVVGRHGMPLAVSLTGTAECAINLVSGSYRS
ncbi:MAG: hypothetical protein KF684_04140 [Phycisphaeraceae bacterium]|nr:hypothetical protein [Phycisphaeraceae bacterium]